MPSIGTTEQRKKWRKTWIDKCTKENKCIVCGKEKEEGRKTKGKCRKCQKRVDLYKKECPQIRPSGRKLIKSIHNVLCQDCKPKIKDLADFWFDGRFSL